MKKTVERIRTLKKRGATQLLAKLPLSPETLLEFYPPFLFMGLKVTHLSHDYRVLEIRVPLRWYFRNHHGTMFGGILAAVVDPLPALMCSRIFPGTLAWTKALRLEFLLPTDTALHARVEVTDVDLNSIREQLEKSKKAVHEFHFLLKNAQGRTVAKVWNTVYLTSKRPRKR